MFWLSGQFFQIHNHSIEVKCIIAFYLKIKTFQNKRNHFKKFCEFEIQTNYFQTKTSNELIQENAL